MNINHGPDGENYDGVPRMLSVLLRSETSVVEIYRFVGVAVTIKRHGLFFPLPQNLPQHTPSNTPNRIYLFVRILLFEAKSVANLC